jgi:expansin (peptidoglycan-binding protein)
MKRALFAAAVAALLAVACGSDDSGSSSGGSSSGSTYSTEQKAGIATYYDADGSGSCSYDTSDDLDVVALNLDEFAGSASCGSCIRVQGAKGSVVVRVTDSCPPCGHHHMDLSAQAFAKIDDPEKGRVNVTYQTVPCDVKGNLSYHYKDGSSQYWTAIQVRNHRVPIAKLEMKKDGAYVDVPRTDYNYFVDEKGAGDQKSLAIRITAADGQVVEDTIPGGIEENATHDGTVQFR